MFCRYQTCHKYNFIIYIYKTISTFSKKLGNNSDCSQNELEHTTADMPYLDDWSAHSSYYVVMYIWFITITVIFLAKVGCHLTDANLCCTEISGNTPMCWPVCKYYRRWFWLIVDPKISLATLTVPDVL